MPSQKDKDKNILVRSWIVWESVVGVILSPVLAKPAKDKHVRQRPTKEGKSESFFAKRKFLLFSSLSFLFLAILASIALFYQSEASAAWFNDNWQYRQKVTFGNSGAAVTSARKVKYDVDTSTLISAGQLQSDCDDLRFTDVNGKLLEYYIDTSGGACNTASTDVYILVASVSTGTNTTYMYYGNPSAFAGTTASQFSESTFSPTSGPTFASAEISEGPVAYWKFDTGAGTTAQDSTQSANDATITNAVWKDETYCKAGKCLEYDGDGDYISLADDSDVDFAAADDFTISGWFRHGIQSSGQDVLIAKTNSTAGYKILMESDGDITFAIDDDATWTPDDSATSTAATYDDNQWHHFAAVKDGTTSITLYIDGQQVAQDSSIAATGTLANAADFYIGIDGDGAANDWDGFIDEIKVYRYARSATQVKLDSENPRSASGGVAVLGSSSDSSLSDGLVGYWPMDEDSGNRMDYSGNDNTMTDQNTVTSNPGKYGYSGQFIRTNSEYLTVASPNGLNVSNSSFTTSAWVYLSSTSNQMQIVNDLDESSNGFRLYYSVSSGFSFELYNAGVVVGSTSVGSAASTARWYHVVAQLDLELNQVRLIVDNSNTYTGTLSGTPVASSSSTDIGGQGASEFWNGRIDEVRIYNRALGKTELSQLYARSPGPVVYYDLENTTTSENLDQSNTTGDSLIYSGSDEYQSFTAGASGELTSFDWYNTVGSDCDSTVHLREGTGTGGTSLANQAIQQRNSGWESFTFTTPGTVSSGSTYSLHFDITDCHVGEESTSNPYAGGRNSNGTSNDYEFRTYVSSTDLADLSGNGNLASISNFTGTYEVKGKYGFAYDFDGSDDSLAIAAASDSFVDFNGFQAFSGSAWVKIETMPGSGNQDAIIAKWDQTGAKRGYRLVVENDDADSTGNFQVELYDESLDQGIVATGANDTVNEGEWYYVHFTYDGVTGGVANSLNLYVNGVLVDGNDTNGSFIALENIAADFTVGNYDSTDVISNNTVFDGIIDDVKVFWYESPTRDIISAYNGDHPLGGSPIASQVGYWSLDEQQGQNAYDRGYGENTAVLGASSTESTDDPSWYMPSSCKVNGCSYFDGGDFTSLADTSELDFSAADLSISAWVYHDSVSGTDTILDKRNSTSEGYHLTNASGTWTFVIEEVTSGDHCTVTSTVEGSTTAEWIHVSANYDASEGTCKLFINGRLVADTTSTSNPTNIDAANSESFRIGSDDGSTNFWAGRIDEVKVYAAVLTPDEIAVDMNGGAAINFGVLGESEASLLGDGVAADPVAEWRFDEGTDNTCVGGTNDICNVTGSGTNYDGTNSSATWVNSAKCYEGKCLQYNGSSSYVDVGTGPSTVNSISFWVNPTTTSEYLIDLNGTAYIRVISGSITATGFTSPTIYVNGLEDGTLSANQWNHVAVTTNSSLNASNLDFGRVSSNYFDGYLDSIKMYNTVLTRSQAAFEYNRGKPVAWYKLDECTGSTAFSSHSPYTTDHNGTLSIGATGSNTSTGSCSSGTSSEAWNNGTTGRVGSSLDFDGTDDYINSNYDPNIQSGDFTISLWHKVSTLGSVNALFATTVESGTYDEAVSLQYHVSNCGTGYINIQTRDTNGATTPSICAQTQTNDGNWHLITFVFDNSNSTKYIYIDGVLDYETAVTAQDAGDKNFTSYPFYIGAKNNRGSPTQYFDGQIDDVRFYNYALSADQVSRLYKNNDAAVSFGQ